MHGLVTSHTYCVHDVRPFVLFMLIGLRSWFDWGLYSGLSVVFECSLGFVMDVPVGI